MPLSCASTYSSFIASFHSLGYWSENEYLEYKNNFPEFKVFTACHWEKAQFFSQSFNGIWAYCQHHSQNDLTLRCIQAIYKPPDERGNIELMLNKFNLHSKGSKEIRKWVVPYRHMHWNHFCWVHPNDSNETELYHNGEKIQIYQSYQIIDDSEHNEFIPLNMSKSTEVYDSAFIIGQEPDSMRGSFEKDESFPGDISELNIWDRVLDEADISGMAKCKYEKRGNIVTWIASKFILSQVKTTNISDLTQFCINKREYVMLPGLLTLNTAIKKCSSLGGAIAVPRTKAENSEILGVSKKHQNKCLVKATWLGIQKPGPSWHEYEINGKAKIIDYFNWRPFDDSKFNRRVDLCAFLYTDGTWGWEKPRTCKIVSMCTICYFTTTPIYTLKGRYQKTPEIERSYYMLINSTHQLDGFNGLRKRTSILPYSTEKWSIKESDDGKDQLLLRDKQFPIGRYIWSYVQPANTQGEQFTLSVCKVGDDYTCNSGECLDMSKRCNKIIDCPDGSDELSCDTITFPLSYIKSHAPSITKAVSKEMNISAQFIIESIDRIDTVQMRIALTVSIQLVWNDHRLIFNNLHDNPYFVSEKNLSKLWLPLDNVKHVNAIFRMIAEDKKKYVKIFANRSKPTDLYHSLEDKHFSGSRNSLSETRSYQIYYNCHFYLEKYPFDKQLCIFGLDLKGQNDEKFIVSGSGKETIFYNGPEDVADFIVTSVSSNITRCKELGGIFNPDDQELTFCLFIERSHTDQLVSLFCPSLLFWILAYFTMFLDIDDVSNRSRTSVTLLLVLIALLQTVKKDFPKTTYYKYVDIWFLWYVFNIFMVSLYHIILPKIRGKRRKGNTALNNKEKEEKTNAWRDVSQDVDSATKIEKLNVLVVVITPLVMLAFNIIYFILST